MPEAYLVVSAFPPVFGTVLDIECIFQFLGTGIPVQSFLTEEGVFIQVILVGLQIMTTTTIANIYWGTYGVPSIVMNSLHTLSSFSLTAPWYGCYWFYFTIEGTESPRWISNMSLLSVSTATTISLGYVLLCSPSCHFALTQCFSPRQPGWSWENVNWTILFSSKTSVASHCP